MSQAHLLAQQKQVLLKAYPQRLLWPRHTSVPMCHPLLSHKYRCLQYRVGRGVQDTRVPAGKWPMGSSLSLQNWGNPPQWLPQVGGRKESYLP